MTLVPSLFEPCGLTQMYGLNYGSLPLVHRVGGLADTVVDCTLEDLADGGATGFCFDDFDAAGFARALRRAFALYARPADWRRVRASAMRRPADWGTRRRALPRRLCPSACLSDKHHSTLRHHDHRRLLSTTTPTATSPPSSAPSPTS